MKANSHLIKEILITFIFLTGYLLCLRIPLPYTDTEAISSFFYQPGTAGLFGFQRDMLSILSLGIMPYTTAYTTIELCSLFVPFLKKYRKGDNRGRVILRTYALTLTLVISIIQSKLILNGLSGMLSPTGGSVLFIQSLSQEIIFILTQVASVFLLILAAELVSRHGIGNGISLLIFGGICSSVFFNIGRFIYGSMALPLNFYFIILFSLAVFLFLISAPVFLIKSSSSVPLEHQTDGKHVNYFKISGCPSGSIATWLASSIVMLPATFAFFPEWNEMLWPGTAVYYLSMTLTIFTLNYLLGRVFLHPEKRIIKLNDWGWRLPEPSQHFPEAVKYKFLLLNFSWTLFLCTATFVPTIAIGCFDAPFFIGGTSLFILGIIGLDIIARLKTAKAFGNQKMIKAAELHDVYDATMIKNHLKAEGIKFYLQGYYHRHALYFLGPYISINLMVAREDMERTYGLINRYYNGLGLL